MLQNIELFSLNEFLEKYQLKFNSFVKDLKDFLQNKAITFEKRGIARTYILYNSKQNEIVGYFSLSISLFLTENKLSKSKIQKIDGFDKNRKCLYFFLIGQLGLDDKYP